MATFKAMKAFQRSRNNALNCFMHKAQYVVSSHRFSTTANDNDSDEDDNCLWLEVDDNKHILVMGIFHHNYSSTLTVQNAINTLKPDTLFLELCPWRGMKLQKIQGDYCKAYHYSPRDVEAAAIFSASKLENCKIIFGDVPEPVIKSELRKYDENVFKILSSQQISMNEFEFYNHENNTVKQEDNGLFIHIDQQNGKQYVLNQDNGDKCYLDSREGIREIMKYNEKHNILTKDVKRILYDDREKYMIKAMVEAPNSNKMLAIVGMSHLDGIEKFWSDEAFWKDKEFWSLKYPEPDKWEVKRYNNLLHSWFRDNFGRVPRFVPKFMKMGGD